MLLIVKGPKALRFTRRFAAMSEVKAKAATYMIEKTEYAVTMSREQAEALCQVLCMELYNVKFVRKSD